MKTLVSVVAAALGLWQAGCTSPAARLDRVHNGMTRETVVALLGHPGASRVRGNSEYLTYYLVTDSKVGEQPYMVRLVEGRVDTVGRFVQLADLEVVSATAPLAGMGAILSKQALPDVATQLRQLAAVKARGELSDADFEKARQEILASADR